MIYQLQHEREGVRKCFIKETSNRCVLIESRESISTARQVAVNSDSWIGSCTVIFPAWKKTHSADCIVWHSLNNWLDYALLFMGFNICSVIYYYVSKWQGKDVKWHKKKCQLVPTKTLNMSIDSDVEGGVCTCMCEGRSDQWRFPLLPSAQQQMGRGCGLAGWVTRIMNLPVVLFNTKKENENRNTYSKVGWLVSKQSKQATWRWTSPLLECAALVTTIFCQHLEEAVAKNTKMKLIYSSDIGSWCSIFVEVVTQK